MVIDIKKRIITELTKKFKKTGKIGFIIPESEEQAIRIINTLAETYIEETKENE